MKKKVVKEAFGDSDDEGGQGAEGAPALPTLSDSDGEADDDNLPKPVAADNNKKEDDSSDDELSDGEISKLMIVTPMRPKKHEGFDRTGDFCSRVKMSQDLAQVINDGLKYYEDVSSVVYKLKFYILFMKQDQKYYETASDNYEKA